MTDRVNNESSSRITFERICELDDRVRVLFDDAKRAGDEDQYFDGIAAWFGEVGYEKYSFKQRLCDLVGWHRHRGPIELESHEAYEVAYRTIFDAMPPDREDPSNCEPTS